MCATEARRLRTPYVCVCVYIYIYIYTHARACGETTTTTTTTTAATTTTTTAAAATTNDDNNKRTQHWFVFHLPLYPQVHATFQNLVGCVYTRIYSKARAQEQHNALSIAPSSRQHAHTSTVSNTQAGGTHNTLAYYTAQPAHIHNTHTPATFAVRLSVNKTFRAAKSRCTMPSRCKCCKPEVVCARARVCLSAWVHARIRICV